MIEIAKLFQTAHVPQRHSDGAAGCDIHSNSSGQILSKEKATINTGISINVPVGHVAMIYGRSGLSNKFWLEVENNCIHPGDFNEVMIYMRNNGENVWVYEIGDRIAQLVFVKVETDVELI